jgi:hypothetical protein
LVYPTLKKIKLLSFSPKSIIKISKKSHSALKTKLEKKFRKCIEKPDIKDLLLFSDADYGPCPRFWQEISNSDYVVEITTPVDEEIRRQVTCERNGNNLVITNNTSEIVCSYPCSIPPGYNIRDLEPLKKYIQSSSSESEGSPVSLILQNIESRPDENKITISIVLTPPEQPIVPDPPATQVSTER